MTESQTTAAKTATDEAQQLASGAADSGRQVAQVAGDQAQQVVGTARDQATRAATEARAQAARVVDDAKIHLRDQARAQTKQLADGLGRLADQLRAVTEGRPAEAGPVADALRQAAERVDYATERVHQGGFEGLVADLQRFARRRPAVFLAGALAAGFGAGRLVRAGRESGALGAAPPAGQVSSIQAEAPEAWPPDSPALPPGTGGYGEEVPR
jgi:X-X-X-Leu-X-X-Gly heptad repeat protein